MSVVVTVWVCLLSGGRCRVLCFVTVLHGCVWYVCCYVMKKVSSVSFQLLRGGIWACIMCPYKCLCWVRHYGFVKSSFKHTRGECKS